MERRVLIDTSAWIEALRSSGEASTRQSVQDHLQEGIVVFCDMVLLELWNGARGDRERAYLKALESEIECLSSSPDVWSRSRDLARGCWAAGLTVPSTDLLIAACALHHGTELFHRDRYLDQILELANSGDL